MTDLAQGAQKPGFLRKYLVAARRLGKKTGFFGLA
jgi:hypothetical protein